MKAKISVFVLTMFVLAGMAFAVNGTGYYNLFKNSTVLSTTLVLSQSDMPCSYIGSANNGCVASVKDTPKNLAKMLNDYWINGIGMRSVPLELGSDIDLGEYSSSTEAGKCDVNHVPLPMMDSTSFDGKNKTVKNLCYAASVSGEGDMTSPIGLFEQVSKVTLKNLNLEGARIYVDGESGVGAHYYPVGALAGIINLATVDNVKLMDVDVQAPMAGGLAGFVYNSTVKHITDNENVKVSNKVAITSGYAGSKVINPKQDEVSVFDYNVFLGGIAGFALRNKNEDPTFIDDSIWVEVHDGALGHMSALGGIAGMFITTGETVKNLQVYSKNKLGDTLSSVISGGSSMGGLFGARMVYVKYNSVTAGNFALTESLFSGSIVDASSPKMIAVGGLIGRDSSVADMSVKISKSRANVSIVDLLKTAGLYRYYAGGVLGYGSYCGSSTSGAEDFVSITDTKVTGNINVAASGKTVDGIHSQTFLGGLAGHACLAQAEKMGLVNDTAIVDIDAKVMTSLDNKNVVNGQNARDSLYVGGMVGYARVRVFDPVVLSGLLYTGSISVVDSLNNVAVGGIIGGVPQNDGRKSLQFKNVLVYGNSVIDNSSNDLITFKAVEGQATTSNPQTAKIGGLCGHCDETSLIERVGVNGNIVVWGKYSGDSLLVGGLVASIFSSMNDFSLKNSFVNGDVNVIAAAKQNKVGYLLGRAVFSGSNEFEMQSVYHYGENKNDMALGPFGALSTGSNITSSWNTNGNIHYIVRNGKTKNLNSNQNGSELATTMKSSKFAGFLNGCYSANDYAWSYKKGENNDLPIFADGKNLPIEPGILPTTYVVTFVYNVNGVAETIKQQTVTKNGAATAPTSAEMPVIEGYTFSGKWDPAKFDNITGDLTVTAVYDIVTYKVKFVDYDGTLIREVLLAVGSTVLEPTGMTRAATADYEYTFKKWDPEVVTVTGDVVYTAVYDSVKIAHGSSSSGKSSSSVASSSSVQGVSSSSVASSSSEIGSSGSNGAGKGELKLVQPKIEQSGNAVRLTFATEGADSVTVGRVIVTGEDGVFLDTVISKEILDGGVWEMAPSPMGKFKIELVLDDNVRKAVFDGEIEVATQLMVDPESWQMISLSALDGNSIVKNDEARLYWWDEKNPIGDYWQYRLYNGESVNGTRGFWYGSMNGKPLVLRESSAAKSSELVWELDSMYSGWNMVANPYGWYIDLSEGKADNDAKVSFWRWNPATSEYEVPTVIAPYEAVWAKVNKQATWRVSAAPVFDVAEKVLKKSALRKANSTGAFTLVATLTDENGKMDSWNVLGAGDEESLEEPPAGMGDHVSLAIRQVSVGKGAKLAKSIVPVASEYQWVLDVSANSAREGELSFEGVADLNKLGLKLFVTADGVTTEVHEGEAVKLALAKTTKQVSVRIAASGAVVASAKLNALRSVWTDNRLQVQFDSPASLAGAKACYTVVGIDGKKVAAGRFKAIEGINQFELKVPRTGVYFIKIKVGNQELSGKALKK